MENYICIVYSTQPDMMSLLCLLLCFHVSTKMFNADLTKITIQLSPTVEQTMTLFSLLCVINDTKFIDYHILANILIIKLK